MNGISTIPYIFSLAVGNPGISAKANFYALFVVLPVTVILIYFFGLVGAGLSWIFYHIFGYFYGIPKICRECIEISVWGWYWHMLRIFVFAGITYGVAWFILGEIGNRSILSLASAYVGASIVFLVGSYFMIGKELRGTIFRYFQALKTKIMEVT